MKINKIHHISIISGHAQETIDFQRTVLGLRLIKKTVNYDNPKMYHLYFGNNKGDFGTVLSFFPQTTDKIEKVVNNSIIILRIPLGTMTYWENRLHSFNINTIKRQRYNKIFLAFKDRHNVSYELTEDQKGFINDYNDNNIDKRNAIKGIYGVVIYSNVVTDIKTFIENDLKLSLLKENHMYYRYLVNGNIKYYIELAKKPVNINKNNIGNIHHIAFGINSKLESWEAQLNENNDTISNIRNLNYFKSLYFNEPGGNLFSLSTDDPGFLIDEKELGNSLIIPSQYKEQEQQIKDSLMPIFNKKQSKLQSYSYIDKQSYDNHIAHKSLLARINELAAKNKSVEGLTPEETKERAILRKKYVKNILSGVNNTLDNVRVVDDKGNKEKLRRKKKSK